MAGRTRPKAEVEASAKQPDISTETVDQFADRLTTLTRVQQGIPLGHKAAFVVAQTAAANWSTVSTISGKDGGSRLIPGCRLGDAMKRLLNVAVGASPLLATETVWAQNGPMMNGGMSGGGWMGGYGGIWGLVLLVIVVAAVVAWAVKRK